MTEVGFFIRMRFSAPTFISKALSSPVNFPQHILQIIASIFYETTLI